jgi:AcrR family transcriptional regulator
MSRPARIDTSQILKAASALFLERGLEVPTAEIARRAGVSEGSIFKRFPTKQVLVVAALELDHPPEWVNLLQPMVGRGEVKENLVRVAVEIIAFVRELLPRMMLLWSSRDQQCLHRRVAGRDSPPQIAIRRLGDYLRQEIHLGRIRSAHPEVMARMLLGSIWNYVFLETMQLMPGGNADCATAGDTTDHPSGRAPAERAFADLVQSNFTIDSSTYARLLVDILWQGIAPISSTAEEKAG